MSKSIPILMYHSVDTDCAPAYRRWAISPERFASHMAALSDRGAKPITVSALADRIRRHQPLEEGTVAITFDDGLADFADQALPILDHHGFASTLFVATGYVGQTSKWLSDLGEGDRRMLGWSEIEGLGKHGVEIGSHAHTHSEMDVISKDVARAEIDTSKKLIEDKIGRAVKSFAYPHGYSSRSVRRFVAAAGYTSACRVAHALSKADEPIYQLSRIVVTEETSPDHIGAYLSGRGLRVAPAQERLQVVMWRWLRRIRRRERSVQALMYA